MRVVDKTKELHAQRLLFSPYNSTAETRMEPAASSLTVQHPCCVARRENSDPRLDLPQEREAHLDCLRTDLCVQLFPAGISWEGKWRFRGVPLRRGASVSAEYLVGSGSPRAASQSPLRRKARLHVNIRPPHCFSPGYLSILVTLSHRSRLHLPADISLEGGGETDTHDTVLGDEDEPPSPRRATHSSTCRRSRIESRCGGRKGKQEGGKKRATVFSGEDDREARLGYDDPDLCADLCSFCHTVNPTDLRFSAHIYSQVAKTDLDDAMQLAQTCTQRLPGREASA